MNAIGGLCTGPQKGLWEPLWEGPLHTQWEPSAGDGLDPDPKISGELSGSFLLCTLAHIGAKKAAQLRTEKGPRS